MNQEILNEHLMQACEKGDLSLVKKLVNDGANIHYKGFLTYTPFEKASDYGHLEVVKFLYSIGCDPTTDDNYAIRWASANGHLEVVKYLHSIGCDTTAINNFAIVHASSYDQLEVVKFLALIGCDTNKIFDVEMRKIAEYYMKYKPIMDTCIAEIYGNPRLERTRTENEISFREYLNE